MSLALFCTAPYDAVQNTVYNVVRNVVYTVLCTALSCTPTPRRKTRSRVELSE